VDLSGEDGDALSVCTVGGGMFRREAETELRGLFGATRNPLMAARKASERLTCESCARLRE
jgi:hypothetical protein